MCGQVESRQGEPRVAGERERGEVGALKRLALQLKGTAGSQLFQLSGNGSETDGLRVTMEEVSCWKVRGALSPPTPSIPR